MKKSKNTLEIEYKAISELIPNPNNARTHSEKQIRKIAKSVQQFGFVNPVLIDASSTIIAGHGRVEAAELIGITEVPTILLENLSKAELRAYVIADNKLAEEAGWDNEILKIELQALMKLDIDFDVTLTGFDYPQIDLIISDEQQDKPDKADILPDESKVKAMVQEGDLWQLGNHYLLCGDALDMQSYEMLLQGEKADIGITDPPYNVKIDGHVCIKGKHKHKEFVKASGEMTSEEFTDFLKTSFGNMANCSKDGSIHNVFMDWRHIMEIMNAGSLIYTEFKNLCVWNKMRGGMGSLYRSQHELVFVFKNGSAPHTNNIELGVHGRYRTNVWDYKGVSANNPSSLKDAKFHPTVKPIGLIMDAIRDCSNPGEIVLDPFAGSGTTLLAAERTKRKAYVIEYEPHYCDVIIHRYEKLFKKQAKFIKNAKGVNNER